MTGKHSSSLDGRNSGSRTHHTGSSVWAGALVGQFSFNFFLPFQLMLNCSQYPVLSGGQ